MLDYSQCYYSILKQVKKYSKSKIGHNFYKMLDRVNYSCLNVEIMMVNKCSKFQFNTGIGYKDISLKVVARKTLTEMPKLNNNHNSCKNVDRSYLPC